MNLLNIWGVLFLIVLSFLGILVHEIGHYAAARYYGVTVLEVSIGLGPCLFRWREPENGTFFLVRMFPVAGYNYYLSASDVSGKHASLADTITQQPRNIHIRITLAGVVANLLFALAALVVGLVVADAAIAQGFRMVFVLSLIDVAVNLLPIKGLDGATLLHLLHRGSE